MSYKAKRSLLAVVAIMLSYGIYFLWAGRQGHAPQDFLSHMIGAFILLATMMILLEIAIAVQDRASARSAGIVDERDRLNDLRSARNGYYVLVSLSWLTPFALLNSASPILVANLLLGILVIAEIVHFSSRVVYDLRGA
jgi:hypothetical protein